MDWRTVTFDWNRARAFLVTAEEGSLSAAARALGQAQPTLGRQVEALERELDVVLFERHGRGLRLTPAGHDLRDHVRAMASAATRVSLAAAGRSQEIEGEVSIAASDADAGLVLPPILARLRQAEPRITIDLVAAGATSDLLHREADIAIRNFRPTEPDLIARKLRDATARLYATPGYLDSLGPLATPDDLRRAAFIGFDGSRRLMDGLNAQGLGLEPANFPHRSANTLVAWMLVRQGLGIGIFDDRIGDADPLVRRVMPGLEPFRFPVWLVAHREIHRSRRLRFVYDFLAEAMP